MSIILLVLALVAAGGVLGFLARQYRQQKEERTRYLRVFPQGKPFTDARQATAHMRTIAVQAWQRDPRTGQKRLLMKRVTVNAALANDVQTIFAEIAADPERFPIKRAEGFVFRRMRGSTALSEHSYGTAIDINPEENYFINRVTGVRAGKYWLPGGDPYSLPANGSVVRIFRRHGWAWGGNFLNPKDYMHFTYLGG